ncbi:hypothetical protein ACIQGO_34875 [Streptomyces shenzhenensis]|uniref:hypothetical protein n=1 Tax=Streptomyces shenzhenensis TaxID=943815 RepID=UPI0037F26319
MPGPAHRPVERLMAGLGLEGVIPGQRRRTTVPRLSAPRSPGLVDQDFTAVRPDTPPPQCHLQGGQREFGPHVVVACRPTIVRETRPAGGEAYDGA